MEIYLAVGTCALFCLAYESRLMRPKIRPLWASVHHHQSTHAPKKQREEEKMRKRSVLALYHEFDRFPLVPISSSPGGHEQTRTKKRASHNPISSKSRFIHLGPKFPSIIKSFYYTGNQHDKISNKNKIKTSLGRGLERDYY
jgi:hypothetical protein